MHGLIEYFEACRELHPLKTVDPSVIEINDGKYYLFNHNISLEQSKAIKAYLKIIKDYHSK